MAELNEAESTKDAKKTKKEKKMEEKAAKKAAKKAKKNHEADKPDAENDDSDSVSSKIVMVLVTILIIAIWLGIFAVFVKADVGGFGSTVLAPALKDVPVLSKILPDSGNITASESTETAGYTNLDDAVSRIKELEKQLDDANSKNQADAQTINDLNAQIQDLSTYKEDQAAFEEEKEKYYEEVVFSDKAPDIKEYKKFYEQVDPANAEILYKQVCEQLEQDDEIKELTEQLENEKSKIGEYYDSLIKLTDQVELTYQAYNKEENTTAEKLKEFCDEKIKFNNFNFKSILQKNSISKADEMVTKKNFASDENQRLSHQLLVLKRNKNTIMKQLQEDIDNLIKKEIKIKREGEVACRKVRTDLFELAMWVNESAQNNGANYLIDRISYDLSGVQTEFPQMKSGSNSKKTQRRRSSIFTSSNVMIHNWFSLQKDIIQTFEKLEKICNI